jgi:arylsulfatase A-like enzyme
MNRREFLGTMAAGALAAQTTAKPNIVVILADDLGIGDVGCFGAKDVRTPNLDRLAAEGVRFAEWHANSPVCSPSRASVLTGKYPQHAGIPEILFSRPTFDIPGLKEGERTLAAELKKLGYRTAAVGKWHLGSAPHSRPRAQGFDEFFGFYSGWIDYYSHRYYTLGGQPIFHDLWRNEEEVWEEPVYQSELWAREANAFLGRQTSAAPFFLYLAFGAPHYPMMVPKRFFERLPATMDRDRRMHAAVVEALDENIGSVLATLKQRGFENTIVFFQSDNGATREVRADHLGREYHGGSNGIYRASKGSLFEGGMHVPAILRWPGKVAAGQVSQSVCMGMDIAPTLLRNAGGAVEEFDGVDLMPQFKPPADRTVFWEYKAQTAARSGKWKLVVDPNEGLGKATLPGTMLFDLEADPSEKRNLADEQPVIAQKLKEQLAAWRARGHKKL